MRPDEQRRIFDEWLASHKGLLFKVVRAYANTPPDQEDLFQEIATQLWRSIPGFRQESALSTWIYRVALNAAISWARLERKHREGKQSLDQKGEQAPAALLEASPARDPRLDWLYAQIHRLNEIDRSLTLLLLEGFSYKEVAATLGISESNAGVRIHRIKAQLTSKSKEASKSQKETRHEV